MTVDSVPVAAKCASARSRVSNGKALTSCDGRSSSARRYRDLVVAFAAELPRSWTELPESARQIVRALAAISVRLEEFEAQRISGELVDAIAWTAAVSNQRRLLRDLRSLSSTPHVPTKANVPAIYERLAAAIK